MGVVSGVLGCPGHATLRCWGTTLQGTEDFSCYRCKELHSPGTAAPTRGPWLQRQPGLGSTGRFDGLSGADSFRRGKGRRPLTA